MNPDEYELMYRVEDRHWWYRSLRAMIDVAWRKYVVVERPRALDVGCGTGGLMHAFAERATWYGVDFSAQALRRCRARNLVGTTKATCLALPFRNDSFDVATAMDLLYHRAVESPGMAVAEIRRVLRPGGVLLLNVPAYPRLQSSHDYAIHTARRFTMREVKGLLGDQGLEVVYATHWNMLLFPPIAALRLLRRNERPRVSDLRHATPGWINDALCGVFAVERALLRVRSLPFGLSIFCVAQKRQ